MRYSVTTTSPSYEPVTLSECKQALEIDDSITAHDDKINLMISAATLEAEKYTGRFFAQRQATVFYDVVADYYRLKIAPIHSIESIEYLSGGSYVAFTNYQDDLDDEPPLIRFTSKPTVDDNLKAVKFVLNVGYQSSNSPADADNIPKNIKQAIIFHVYQSFLTRGEFPDLALTTFRNMLHPYRLVGL